MNKDLIYALVLENAIMFTGRASAGPVIGILVAIDPEVKANIKELSQLTNKIVNEVNSLTLEEQKSKFKNLEPLIHHEEKVIKTGLPELENVDNNVVLRFAPYPSGPLHLGNAKQLILNDEYARRYSGKLLLVYDDTIGSDDKTISSDAYKLILDGIQWLGARIAKIYYKSDRLDIYYKYAIDLINENKAYICFCKSEILRKKREMGLDCEHRSYSISQNLDYFNQMLRKKFKPGEVVLRIKTSMTHKNPAFRDRVLFRISVRNHPRSKKKYSVWPLLEFSWAIDDHLLNVTHILRGKDLMIESEMEKFIWDIFGWKHPELIHTGMIKLEGIKLSKSKSKHEVTSGVYKGWDDHRTWSLQSLRRRGFLPEAIRKFLMKPGLSKNDVSLPIDDLYAENRALIDKDSNRYFFIQDPKLITIDKFKGRNVEINLHPDYPDRGKRKLEVNNKIYINNRDYIELKENKLFRLMDCVNFIKKKNRFIFHSTDYANFKDKGSRIIHWLPENGNLKASVVMDDGNIVKGLLERNASKLKINGICQFERAFFAKLDKKSKNEFTFYFTHK